MDFLLFSSFLFNFFVFSYFYFNFELRCCIVNFFLTLSNIIYLLIGRPSEQLRIGVPHPTKVNAQTCLNLGNAQVCLNLGNAQTTHKLSPNLPKFRERPILPKFRERPNLPYLGNGSPPSWVGW